MPISKILKKKNNKIKSFPSHFNIGHLHHKIRQVKTIDCPGLCIFERSEIYIKHDLGSEESKSTLFHEYCHASLYNFGIIPSDKMEEQICQCFSQSIMELIRDPDNWKIIKWAREKKLNDSFPLITR